MPEQYLEKAIEAPCGGIASVWDGTMFNVDLETGKGVISLSGYFSVEALQGRMSPMAHASEPVEHVGELQSYETFFGEVLAKVITDPTSPWHNGTIAQCPTHVHGRNLIKPIVVENGMTAECWRCLSMRANMRKGSVTFKMAGWLNDDAFCTGKASASGSGRKWDITLSIADFQTYPTLYAELVTALISTEGGKMHGATLETTVDPEGSNEPA